MEHCDVKTLLQENAFIRFDRRAWAGRTIDAELRRMCLRVQTEMELDSQNAIIQMVASSLGVAVIPLSRRELANLPGLTSLPFASPQQKRNVVLVEREDRPAGRLAAALVDAIRLHAGDEAIHEKNLS